MAVLLGVWRMLIDYWIAPRVLGHELEIHPLLAIFTLMAGGAIGGLVGVYLPCLSLRPCGLSGADSRHPRHTTHGQRPSFRSPKVAKDARICGCLCKLIAPLPWSP